MAKIEQSQYNIKLLEGVKYFQLYGILEKSPKKNFNQPQCVFHDKIISSWKRSMPANSGYKYIDMGNKYTLDKPLST